MSSVKNKLRHRNICFVVAQGPFGVHLKANLGFLNVWVALGSTRPATPGLNGLPVGNQFVVSVLIYPRDGLLDYQNGNC